MNDRNNDPKVLLVGLVDSPQENERLGWAFVDRVISQGYDFIDCKYRTKLHPEDAELISQYDVVIFVTACLENTSSGFEIRRCFTAAHSFYSNALQAPSAILHLTNKLYNKSPKAYLISISAEAWDDQASFSNEAESNLQAAMEYFNEQLLPSVLAVTA